MPQTFPCADTRCNGRALENGKPCPECQKQIDNNKKKLSLLKWLWAGWDEHRESRERRSHRK